MKLTETELMWMRDLGLTEQQTRAVQESFGTRFSDSCTPEDAARALAAEGHPAWADDRPDMDLGPPQELAPQELAPKGLVRAAEQGCRPKELPAVVEEPQQAELAAPAEPRKAPEGAECLDQSDLAIPYLSLAQDQTTAEDYDVEAGCWFLATDPEDADDERAVAILDVRKGRDLMPPYQKPDEEEALRKAICDYDDGLSVPDGIKGAWCRSEDRVRPSETSPVKISLDCVGCTFAGWKVTGGVRLPPPCGEVYNVLVADCKTQMPAWYRVKSSAIKPFKGLLTLLSMASRRAKNAPLASFFVVLRSKMVIKNKNKYYKPVFSKPERIEDPDEVSLYLALRRGIVGA